MTNKSVRRDGCPPLFFATSIIAALALAFAFLSVQYSTRSYLYDTAAAALASSLPAIDYLAPSRLEPRRPWGAPQNLTAEGVSDAIALIASAILIGLF